ncbi:hypothetical protein ACLB2K_072440 [Fragaria x ananassa]
MKENTLHQNHHQLIVIKVLPVNQPGGLIMKIVKTHMLNSNQDKSSQNSHRKRLSLHPNETEAGIGYISLYLAIAETDSYPEGWEVYADYKLFVLDHLQKKYLTVQDADGDMKRFHKEKSEWGFAKLITLEAFKNSSNGYLVDDCCEFGAEVFVYSRNSKWESLAMVKEPSDGTFRYEMENFSAKTQSSYDSKLSVHSWRTKLEAKGFSEREHCSERQSIIFILTIG